MTSLHLRIYAPRGVLRVIQMRFLPSWCAERGPVAETEVGTVGNGRGGWSFLIRRLEFVGGALPGSAVTGCRTPSVSTAFSFPFLVGLASPSLHVESGNSDGELTVLESELGSKC
jgi:hypothetical protein